MNLTQIERSWLLLLFNYGYRYLARNESGSLYAYKSKPKLNKGFWIEDGVAYKLSENLFSRVVLSNDTSPCEIVCNAPLDYYDLEEV